MCLWGGGSFQHFGVIKKMVITLMCIIQYAQFFTCLLLVPASTHLYASVYPWSKCHTLWTLPNSNVSKDLLDTAIITHYSPWQRKFLCLICPKFHTLQRNFIFSHTHCAPFWLLHVNLIWQSSQGYTKLSRCTKHSRYESITYNYSMLLNVSAAPPNRRQGTRACSLLLANLILVLVLLYPVEKACKL